MDYYDVFTKEWPQFSKMNECELSFNTNKKVHAALKPFQQAHS